MKWGEKMANNEEYFSSRLDTFLSGNSKLKNGLLVNKLETKKEQRKHKILNAYDANNRNLKIFKI